MGLRLEEFIFFIFKAGIFSISDICYSYLFRKQSWLLHHRMSKLLAWLSVNIFPTYNPQNVEILCAERGLIASVHYSLASALFVDKS